MSLDLARKYLDRLLESVGGRWRVRDEPGAEVIPGLLYRFRTVGGSTNEQVIVSLFLRVGALGGSLWEQEMRALQRITGFGHPALPRLLDGGRLEGVDGDVGAAYVRTLRGGGTSASDDWFRRAVAEDRGRALPHLWLLADALGVLHDASVSHRSLWPGALLVRESADQTNPGEIQAVELTRFEMSALLANLFRRRGDASYNQIREAYLANGPSSLLYTPPERLNFIMSRPNGELGGPPGDVFSLGMIAAEWLVVGPPLDPAPATHEAISALQTEIRRRVAVAGAELPGQLRETIHAMLSPDPRSRPTAFQVAQSFAEGFADAQRALTARDSPEPYLISYMPQQSDILLLDKWRFIQQSATTDIGRDQLTDLIEQDMRGAEVIFSPNGALGFATDEKEKLRRAKTVIVGTRVTWFCEPFWASSGGRIRTFKEMLVIKYVRRTESVANALEQLRVNALVQRVPVVEAEPAPMNDPDTAEFLCEGRPDWGLLLQPAQSGRVLSPREQDYLDSLEWYLKYQSAMLDARTYAYQIDPYLGSADRISLRWDSESDRTRRLPDDQRLSSTAILDMRRPDMAVFVSESDDGVDRGRIRLAAEHHPNWGQAGIYEVVDVIEPDTVVISLRGVSRPPERGWLRLNSDAGTPPQIQRQREALVELTANRALLGSLIDPRPQRRPKTALNQAGGDLLGDGRDAVQEILAHDGIFALQGPPGTGKTEVTSQAVVDYLTSEPTARILVSAQSHDALDNLAVRITRKLGITVPENSRKLPTLDRLALRIQPRRGISDVSAELESLQPAALAHEVTSYSLRRSRHWLTSRRSELPSMIDVVQRWIRRAPASQLELTRRVRGAANVVFATTGASTRRNLLQDASTEPFDWVVIEEAARAWPTELALPLVRGVRWTLVGDHAQIGAYSRAEVERFLESLAGYDRQELIQMYEDRERHSRNFSTFAGFFEPTQTARPTKVLREQYRMHTDISQVVGEVFYSGSGGLETMRTAMHHPLEAPGALTAKRLVWIDTGLSQRCVGFWSNDHEASICASVVRAMRPAPGTIDGPSLAVITPYRDQVQRLQNVLNEHYARIHTIDGFQGREADVVVVSLVRDRSRPGSSAIQAVGHVADPPRINVALSRARELLVVVGRFDLYATDAGPAWRRVTDQFRQANAVIEAEDWRIG